MQWIEQELRKLAFDEDHHLGMGDIRITQGMLDELFDKSREMEKDQIKQAFMEGALSWATGSGADDYYNETHGQQ